MTVAPDGTVFIVYEHVIPDGTPDKKRNITFARFTLEWLTDGKDRLE